MTSENTTTHVSCEDLTIGIDIGGTGIKGGIVNVRTGELVSDRFRIPTPSPATPVACAEVVAEIVQELQSRPVAPAKDSPIGVDFPAIVKNGVALSAANVDKSWIGVNIEQLMSEALGGRTVYALNDADAAGLAEAYYGQGRDKQGLIAVITLGTGIGSALILNGQLIPNTELGHLELDGENAESRASARARERDDLSWKKYGKRLHRYFSHLTLLFSPDLFIIGGGISKNPEKFMPYFEDDLDIPMVMAALRNNAGIVGAALWAFGFVEGERQRLATEQES
ncbi:polyphosphate--glucose phosphotransferase [Rothia sp. CCM 9419]|uniref:polyphosphate--glucose phosphotransferase n=1 Tax=Rothia sp. CCM 9419 TaxID=3402662 RepID=UPI003AEC5B17